MQIPKSSSESSLQIHLAYVPNLSCLPRDLGFWKQDFTLSPDDWRAVQGKDGIGNWCEEIDKNKFQE